MRLYIWKMKPTWRARQLVRLPEDMLGDFVAVDGDAAARGNVEAAEKIQQRGFAGAAGAHEGHKLAFVDIQIQALQDVNLFAAATVRLVQAAHLDQASCATAAVYFDHYQRLPILDLFLDSCFLILYFFTSTAWPSFKFAGGLSDHGVSRCQAGQNFDIGSAVAAHLYGAPLSMIILDEVDDFLCAVITNSVLRT